MEVGKIEWLQNFLRRRLPHSVLTSNEGRRKISETERQSPLSNFLQGVHLLPFPVSSEPLLLLRPLSLRFILSWNRPGTRVVLIAEDPP